MTVVSVTTCKGRLDHLKLSTLCFLQNTTYNHIIVDYNCPQQSGKWAESLGNKRITTVYDSSGSEYFHKTVALNLGAKAAIEKHRPDYLLFFDADTIILDGFQDKIEQHLSPDKFLFIKSEEDNKDLTGLLVVPYKMFKASRGFEESFRGWGIEDLEYRIRLYAKHKFEFTPVKNEFLDSIHHSDSLRTQYYKEKDIEDSNVRNWKRLVGMFSVYRNQDLTKYDYFEDRDNIVLLLGKPFDNTEKL